MGSHKATRRDCCRSVSNGRDITYSYTYDANGNITSVSDGTNTTSYAYDSANQLIRENNQEVGESWTWTYDAGGNIASRTFYYYSDGDLGGARYAWNYGYNDSDWGELLTDWWGLQSSYDEIGNLVDSGVCTYTWEHGRQLHTMAGWTFFYDANGMRIGRSNGSSTYSYIYNGSQLSRMTVDGLTMDFTYDASGRPVSITYGNAVYFYVLNLQGDVVAILDSSGNTVVTYAYDAWGYERNRGGSLKDTLGYYNPLRYRGYIYDPEFKLYYLQSRFYDPGLGAFNAPDAFVSTGQGLLGNNMFAYCNNNPVGFVDESGAAAKSCLSADGQIDNAPWHDVSPSGGGRLSGNYSSGNNYGSPADKFYTVRLIKYVTNTDEQVVLDAKYFAFYKGALVIKSDNPWGSFSFGSILLNTAGSTKQQRQTLSHEYGHYLHMKDIGVQKYAVKVVVPSFVGAVLSQLNVLPGNYYDLPWEYIAEQYGRVNRGGYAPWADELGTAYWLYSFV